jgi:MFS transporter, CP family, cyanate transporter
MFNLRTRPPLGPATLGGFAMRVDCIAGTLGQLLGGWLHAVSGGWATPLWICVRHLRARW